VGHVDHGNPQLAPAKTAIGEKARQRGGDNHEDDCADEGPPCGSILSSRIQGLWTR
jgi:hypothetical protein